MPKAQEIKTGAIPTANKTIRHSQTPEQVDHLRPAWGFRLIDLGLNDWNWNQVDYTAWIRLLKQLQSFESLTWGEIKLQTSGKRKGTRHHFIGLEKLEKAAKDRWIELHLDDYGEVYSLRMEGKLRIYGIREGRVLHLVWYDPHHGDTRGVCPSLP